MKKTLLTMAISTLLFACSQETTPPASTEAPSSASAAATTTTTTADMPILRVRMANEQYPPFSIFNVDNSFSGLDAEVLQAIAKDQNFKLEIVPYVWSVIFQDLTANNVDMVVNGLSAEDIDTETTVASKSYMNSPNCVVGADDAALQNWQSKTVGVTSGDELDESLQNDFQVSKTNIQHVKAHYEGLLKVSKKELNSVVADCYVLKYNMKNSLKDINFAVKELPISAGDVSYDLIFAVNKDRPALLEKINTGLDNIKQNGELDKILQKWQTVE